MQYRTFCLKGPGVNWQDWINSRSSTNFSPQPEVEASHPQPAASSPRCSSFSNAAFDPFYVEQPKGVKKYDWGETTFYLPELTEQLKIVAFILARDWFYAGTRLRRSVLLAEGAGGLSGHVAGVEHGCRRAPRSPTKSRSGSSPRAAPSCRADDVFWFLK